MKSALFLLFCRLAGFAEIRQFLYFSSYLLVKFFQPFFFSAKVCFFSGFRISLGQLRLHVIIEWLEKTAARKCPLYFKQHLPEFSRIQLRQIEMILRKIQQVYGEQSIRSNDGRYTACEGAIDF